MIITQLSGGLGNQFFQYAMARRLAHYHGTDFLLDTSNYHGGIETRPQALKEFTRELGLLRFQIKARIALPEEVRPWRDTHSSSSVQHRLVRLVRRIWPGFLWRMSHIVERQYTFQPEAMLLPDNVYLQGFWQSEKYFADVAPEIRRELQPQDHAITKSAQTAVEKFRSQHGPVVSLHVRRGDLAFANASPKRKSLTHGAPVTLTYIDEAMRAFPEDACFFVFSDSPQDIKWCRQNIGGGRKLEFSTATSDIWDLVAMQHCDHHIIANSTFSWWAAWLDSRAGRKVVAPSQWCHPGGPMVTDDLIPSGWILI